MSRRYLMLLTQVTTDSWRTYELRCVLLMMKMMM